MRDNKALEFSRFAGQFEKEIAQKNEWTQNELLIIIREVLANKASTIREEKDILESQLALLKKQREPMIHELQHIEKKADKRAVSILRGFFGIILSQFILVQYGTYIALSWDIMEPITCAMTLGDAVCAYFFWIWSKKPYTVQGLSDFFFERKKLRLIKKNQMDYENYLKTEEAIKIIKHRLAEL